MRKYDWGFNLALHRHYAIIIQNSSATYNFNIFIILNLAFTVTLNFVFQSINERISIKQAALQKRISIHNEIAKSL